MEGLLVGSQDHLRIEECRRAERLQIRGIWPAPPEIRSQLYFTLLSYLCTALFMVFSVTCELVSLTLPYFEAIAKLH